MNEKMSAVFANFRRYECAKYRSALVRDPTNIDYISWFLWEYYSDGRVADILIDVFGVDAVVAFGFNAYVRCYAYRHHPEKHWKLIADETSMIISEGPRVLSDGTSVEFHSNDYITLSFYEVIQLMNRHWRSKVGYIYDKRTQQLVIEFNGAHCLFDVQPRHIEPLKAIGYRLPEELVSLVYDQNLLNPCYLRSMSLWTEEQKLKFSTCFDIESPFFRSQAICFAVNSSTFLTKHMIQDSHRMFPSIIDDPIITVNNMRQVKRMKMIYEHRQTKFCIQLKCDWKTAMATFDAPFVHQNKGWVAWTDWTPARHNEMLDGNMWCWDALNSWPDQRLLATAATLVRRRIFRTKKTALRRIAQLDFDTQRLVIDKTMIMREACGV